jgi:hypothetical protein
VRKFFQFFSLTMLTQGVLLLNQVVLLPIQIRIWGHISTAHWYTMLAIATIVSVSDCGLRTAGHAELIRYAHDPADEQAKTEFQHLWAWIRILIFVVTITVIGLDLSYTCLYTKTPYFLWRAALVVGVALETIVYVRVMYLDSLELYRQAEAGYLLLAATRLCLAIATLTFFHSPPKVLAWIWCLSGLFAIAHQSTLCRRIGLLRLLEPMPPGLSFRTLRIAQYTMADPASGWMRAYVPVLVLSAIAQPVAVTIYVALRALFGTARQMILQLSRYASVQYVCLKESHQAALAETQFTLCVLFAAFFASVITGIVVADNFRLASFWLVRSDPTLYAQIAITFGLASPLYAYQIMQALMLRHGKVNEIARRQYLYIVCLVVFSVVALLTKSVLLWLILILIAEVTISLSFMLRTPNTATSAGVRGSLAALASALLGVSLWLLVRFEPFDFLRQSTTLAIVSTFAFSSLWILVIAALYLYIGHDLLSEARTLAVSALGTFFNSRPEEPAND